MPDRAVSLRLVLAHCLCWAVWAFSSVAGPPAGESAPPLDSLSAEDASHPGALAVVSGLESAALLCEPDVLESGDAEATAEAKCERREVASSRELGTVPGTDAAPMCDLTGASVEARVEIPEVDQGRLDVLPCEVVAALFGWKLDELQPAEGAALLGDQQPAPPRAAPQERAAAVLETSLPVLARAEPRRLPAPQHVGLESSRGHRARLYRPPLLLS